MKPPIEGGCACGAVRYRCDAEPLMTFQCHCRDCQRASGGPFVAAAVFPAASVTFTRGAPKRYATPSTAGGHHIRGFCETCGSRLTGGESDQRSSIIGITAASLDDPGAFKPQMHFFVSHAQPWDVINDGLPQYDLYPPEP